MGDEGEPEQDEQDGGGQGDGHQAGIVKNGRPMKIAGQGRHTQDDVADGTDIQDQAGGSAPAGTRA